MPLLQPLVHSVCLLLCLGTVIVNGLNCPTDDIRVKLESHVMKDASVKFTDTFSEYYVTSLLETAYRCGYITSKKDTKKENHYEVALVIEENYIKTSFNYVVITASKRLRLSMSENTLGVLELRELGVLVTKIYPVFVTDNVIGYFTCLPIKQLNLGRDSVLWATVAFRTDKISEPELGKDIQAAYDKITGLSEVLPQKLITLEKKKVFFCPEKEVDDDEPSVEV